MLRSRVRRGRLPCLAGVRTAWRTTGDGEFFCPACGGDRAFRHRTGHRRLVLLGLPLLPRGTAPPVVECAACRGHFGTAALEGLTTHRLSALLRDAVHSVALAVLAASGCGSRTTREAAVEAVRAAGYPECTEDQLLALLAAVRAGPLHTAAAALEEPDPQLAVHIGLCEVLEPLAPHLAAPGRERLLLHGAAIALADGPYQPAEREVLETVARTLAIRPADTERLLAAARAPSS
ncbi:TerB family tellurite resistance protein [Streptomyces sp. JJ36]|uniref:TerB family tellurite resistance protein n=1 Tax=Streptomyces sp. JJ36 TaxID=2736645 RepID=UPI001F3A5F68|nr:TerB family tellurite resistance protein [Streptomyces sp. JJ36]MCF6521716.1 TerB family tellurite resistance protein [Streptomyces sp. JJ36]